MVLIKILIYYICKIIEEKNDDNQNNIGLFIGLGTSVGTSLWVVLGAMFNNIGLGISLGISSGVVLGLVFFYVMQKRNSNN